MFIGSLNWINSHIIRIGFSLETKARKIEEIKRRPFVVVLDRVFQFPSDVENELSLL